MTVSQLDDRQLLKLARAFHTKKNLGQHFLVNENAINGIVAALDLKPDEQVLEIGPGIGFLTRLLCDSCKSVTAVDLDRESIEYLKKMQIPNLSIKHGDILAYDLKAGRFRDAGSTATAWAEPDDKQHWKIVGNLPYQITGLILGHLLGEIGEAAAALSEIDNIVLTVQKEVAHRMVAKAGSKNYAQLSLLIAYFCDAEIILDLPASYFYPAPRVDSAVIRLIPLKEPRVKCNDAKFLRRVIRAGFAQRRKMLRNALTALPVSADQLNALFKEMQYDPQVRAESLSLQQFAMLSDVLAKLVANK